MTISYGFPTGASYGASSFVRGALPPGVVCRHGRSFAPDGYSFLAPDKDGFIEAWDAGSMRRIGRLPVGSNHWDVAISPDSLWLATGEIEGTVTVWDWTGRRAVTNSALPFEWFGRMYFSRSGRCLFANSVFHNRQCNWRRWRTHDWQPVPLPGVSPSSAFYMGGIANAQGPVMLGT